MYIYIHNESGYGLKRSFTLMLKIERTDKRANGVIKKLDIIGNILFLWLSSFMGNSTQTAVTNMTIIRMLRNKLQLDVSNDST